MNVYSVGMLFSTIASYGSILLQYGLKCVHAVHLVNSTEEDSGW